MTASFFPFRGMHSIWFLNRPTLALRQPDTATNLPRFEPSMKKPTQEERQRMCTRKRRYRTQADALDAALLAGVARHRQAYLCPICKHWHPSSN